MIKWVLATVFATILGFGLYLAIYLGVFSPVKISEGEAPPFILLSKSHIGPYDKIVPIIEEVESWAKARGIDCTQSFGLYEDDPNETEQERLRSRGGCWISDASKITDLPTDFKIETWSAPYFVKAVFEGSPSIGPMKVYPKAGEYFESHHYKRLKGTLEVYVIHPHNEMTTTYYFAAEKHPDLRP